MPSNTNPANISGDARIGLRQILEKKGFNLKTLLQGISQHAYFNITSQDHAVR
jgi:hypothetical protein